MISHSMSKANPSEEFLHFQSRCQKWTELWKKRGRDSTSVVQIDRSLTDWHREEISDCDNVSLSKMNLLIDMRRKSKIIIVSQRQFISHVTNATILEISVSDGGNIACLDAFENSAFVH
jgi:hypothetical protein